MNTNNEWNASLNGDFLWSNVNFGEAVTETMTPLTWSVIQFTLEDWRFLPGYPTVGNIGGMPYLNISVFATLFQMLGRDQEDLLAYMEGTLYMQLPAGMQIPLIKLSLREKFAGLVAALGVQIKQRRGICLLPAYLAEAPSWFKDVQADLENQTHPSDLHLLWEKKISVHIKKGVWCVLGSAAYSSDFALHLRRELTRLVGPQDANILIANLSGPDDLLDSLGVVVGLSKLARGEITREAYLTKYGHRGPNEFELSYPPPAENNLWLEDALENLRRHPVDIDGLLEKQKSDYQAAWERLESKYPHKAIKIRRRIQENARRVRMREQARSEYTRDRWLIRLFALRAAELTGIGTQVFFLNLGELLALLSGNQAVLDSISKRKRSYETYKKLPVYPSLIRGHFDPLHWAADPIQKRNMLDVVEPYPVKKSKFIKGSPGSAGKVVGIARIVDNPEQSQILEDGEILVTVQTDVAWTLLFPRAAAVITDVGAPLSHAAIVARELGIPAVVGCGDATSRLKTGDRIRVDGARGIVEIL
jgi:phosphohistidine swiveling domain-containing protein